MANIALSIFSFLENRAEKLSSNWHRSSLASKTHSFVPIWKNVRFAVFGSRCYICDHKVYLKCFACRECGLSGHKECLKGTVIECANQYPIAYRFSFSVFGIDLKLCGGKVPEVIHKCVVELESRGFKQLKGIYKRRGNETVVNMLVKSFNIAPHFVDLCEIDVNDIGDVLKKYLIELKEPLMTFDCYDDCMRIATAFPMVIDLTGDYALKVELVSELLRVMFKLPTSHRSTLAFLVHHLKRIADNRSKTDVSIYDISEIFAPIILRSNIEIDSVIDMFEAYRRARFTEVMIEFSESVFGPCPPSSQYCSTSSLQITNREVTF